MKRDPEWQEGVFWLVLFLALVYWLFDAYTFDEEWQEKYEKSYELVEQ